MGHAFFCDRCGALDVDAPNMRAAGPIPVQAFEPRAVVPVRFFVGPDLVIDGLACRTCAAALLEAARGLLTPVCGPRLVDDAQAPRDELAAALRAANRGTDGR